MMSKHFLTLVITIITFLTSAFAQQDVLFQVKLIPNKTYVTEMQNDMKMVMDFEGNEEKRNEMIKNGMKLPMNMDMLQEMSLSTKTGKITADKRIPLVMSYDKMAVKMTMDGKEINQPNPLKDLKIKGYSTGEGKIAIESVEGGQSPVKNEEMEKMLSQMLSAVQFPNKVLKIGDSFTQEVPMVMPIAGNSLNMMTKMVYTLKELKDQKAFFDYTLTLAMDMKIEQVNSTATGSGAGKMIYDIPTNYVTETTGDMIMNMNMGVGADRMKITAKAKSNVKARIL